MRTALLLIMTCFFAIFAIGQDEVETIGKEEFLLLTQAQQKEFILRVQHMVIKLEKASEVFDVKNVNSPKQVQFNLQLQKLKQLYALLIAWDAMASDSDTSIVFDFKNYVAYVPPSLRCTWNGYPSIKIMGPGYMVCASHGSYNIDMATMAQTCLKLPSDYALAKSKLCSLNAKKEADVKFFNSFIKAPLKNYYGQAKCALNSQIPCNPQLFGTDNNGQTMCSEKSRSGDHYTGVNSAFQCMKSSLNNNSAEKLAQKVYNFAKNGSDPSGQFFLQMSQMVYSLCVCHDFPTIAGEKQKNETYKDWQQFISPGQDCFAFLNFSRKVLGEIKKLDQSTNLCLRSGDVMFDSNNVYARYGGAVSLSLYADTIDSKYKENLLARITGASSGSSKALIGLDNKEETFQQCLNNRSPSSQSDDKEVLIDNAKTCFDQEASSYKATNSVMTGYEKDIASSQAYKNFSRSAPNCPLAIVVPNCRPVITPAPLKDCSGLVEVKVSCPEKKDEPLECTLNGKKIDSAKCVSVSIPPEGTLTVNVSNGTPVTFKNPNKPNALGAIKFDPPSGKEFSGPLEVSISDTNSGKISFAIGNDGKYSEGNKATLSELDKAGEVTLLAKSVIAIDGKECSSEGKATYIFKPIFKCEPTVEDSGCGDATVNFNCSFVPPDTYIKPAGGDQKKIEAGKASFSVSERGKSVSYEILSKGQTFPAISVDIPAAKGISPPNISPDANEIKEGSNITLSLPDGLHEDDFKLTYQINGAAEQAVDGASKDIPVPANATSVAITAKVTALDAKASTACKEQSLKKDYKVVKEKKNDDTADAIETPTTATTTPRLPNINVAPRLPNNSPNPNLIPTGPMSLDGVL